MKHSTGPTGGFADILTAHAETRADVVALRFLADQGDAVATLTYAQLARRARAIAAAMHAHAPPGERALLLFPSGPDYVAAFFGCLYAGIIAVPAYPPESARPQALARIVSILHDASPRLVLTTAALQPAIEAALQATGGTCRVMAVDAVDDAWADTYRPVPGTEPVAFLQYTSGSTAQPKGVMVTHDNLRANEAAIRHGFGIDAGDTIVSWLPLYHDMGLIGGLLQPIYSGVPVVLMSPQRFLQRPLCWLEAIAAYGGTVSGGPDFAYRLCAERIPDAAVAGLDLSRWRVAFSGSEPVRADTLRAFAERFASAGFQSTAVYPCYGLAEATLFVSGGQRGEGLRTLRLDRHALAEGHAVLADVQAGTPDDGEFTELADCGAVAPGHAIRIAHPDTGDACADGVMGEIWAAGDSIASGYWRNADATDAAFPERDGHRWLRTGDLGFVADGRLFIGGRQKDMIIVRGQNHYPQDVEAAVEREVEVVRKGRVAAFAITLDGEEGIGVAAEVGRGVQKLVPPQTLAAAIAQAAAQAHGEPARVVVLLQAGGMPKTSSGKLQRQACRRGWQDGNLDAYAVFENGRQAGAMNHVAPPATSTVATGLSAVEAAVAAIWSDVLQSPALQPTDNFFAVGGSSLAAARILARIDETLGVRLSLGLFFDAPELRAFAAAAGQAGASVGAAPGTNSARTHDVPADTPPRHGDFPLSPAQRRLWFLAQLEPASPAYHIAGALHVRGVLDRRALEAAFARLVQRHESLRTTFHEIDGEAVQRVHASLMPAITFEGASASASGVDEAGWIEHQMRSPFDLPAGPLLRVAVRVHDAGTATLVLTVHHLVADGWSMNVLVGEFSALYREACGAGAAGLPPLVQQYADHAVAEIARTGQAPLAGASRMEWWRSYLGDDHTPLAMPADFSPPARPQHRAGTLAFALPPALHAALRRCAERERVTLFMVLMAGFQVLLQRYCRQDAIRVGVPVANRYARQLESVIGFFVDTRVVHTVLGGAESFSALVQRIKAGQLDADRHGDVAFEQLVEALQPERGHDHHPLFQAMLNLQQRDLAPLRTLPDLAVEAVTQPVTHAKVGLYLNVEEDTEAGTLGATLHYASERFSAASMQGFRDNLLDLLQALADQPERPVGSHALASVTRREVVQAWSQGRALQAGEAWVHERIAAQAALAPDAVAVIDGAHRLHYGALDAQAIALACRLRAQGVGPDDRVAIVLGRGVQAVVAVLATLKAGAAYVPIDIEYPAGRRRDMLDDAAVTCVLTDAGHVAELAAQHGVPVLAVEDATAQSGPAMPPPATLAADHLAYVIYTSGSTGRPKGAANTHGALRSRLAWMQAEYGMGADDAVLFKTPFSFDVSVWEILLPLMSGGRVVVAAPAEHRDPQRLCELVRAHGVTTVHFVPSMLQLWIEEPGLAACSTLRRVFSGGEALSPALCVRVLHALPNVRFDNRYGPSEATINATWWRCDGATPALTRVPIGTPIPDSAVRILDARLNPVPPGVPGELYLGGEGVARGYMGRPAQTAERFVADPLATRPGARLYRTGDLARWREDGVIEYLGRIDDQVKLRGLRIELGEIEAQLQALPGITAAAVRVCGEPGRERLAGYVAAEAAEAAQDHARPAALRAALAQRLPDYMVPAVILVMPSLPRLPSGKIDRRALPDIGAEAPAGVRRLPQAPEALAIAGIWQQILQVPEVGLDDDFFALGGHSLLAMQVVSRVRAAFDVALPLRALFDAPVLEDFAACVCAAVEAGQPTDAPALVPVARDADLPLSHSQERMWFLWRSEPDGVAYNVGGAVRLTGTLDAPALQRALDALLLRHESLRTTFPAVGGVPVQRIAAAPDVRIAQVDLRGLPASGRPDALDRLADTEANTPFDLERGPLLRMTLVAEADAQHVLLVTIHHIVSEGWAMDVFAEEFATLYGAMVVGDDAIAALPPLPVQYADYAVWQRKWLASGERARQLDYWRTRLGNEHPVLELPSDRPRQAVQSTRGDIYRFELDDALSARIRQFGTEHGVTLFMTVSATLFALMYRYSGQPLLRLGFPVANRVRPELEGLIGAFLNTLVLQCEIDATTTVADLFAQVRRAAVEAQNHQDLPFHQLVDALQPRRSAAHSPLFQAMVNVQRWRFQQTRDVAGLNLTFLPNDSRATKFDLMLDVTDIDARLGCMLTYSTDLFDRDTVARMASHWLQLLRAMVCMPDSRVAALPMIDADARMVLRGMGAPSAAASHAVDTLHARIEAHAADRPDAVAVVFEDERLTYAELNTRANRLAHALIGRGVGPEVKVGIAARRSAELVVGLLAILKAGGAYVPLDPDYPPERLAYMIEDSG
ncbi:non-ribosomal peptide synthetase, partial [Cupriavidus pauculus]